MKTLATVPGILSAAALLGTAHAVTISQTAVGNDSGTADFGQEIRLDSTIFDDPAGTYRLDSVTFYKGAIGSASGARYLDIYIAGSSAEADPDVDTSVASLTYLGSSTNSVDYDSLTGANGDDGVTLGDAMTFSFSGINLLVDRDVFLVFSLDAIEGNFIGTSTNTVRPASNQDNIPTVYTNITDTDSDPLFGGTGDASDQDHTYTMEVTAVPETSVVLLGGLGLLALLRRRRA